MKINQKATLAGALFGLALGGASAAAQSTWRLPEEIAPKDAAAAPAQAATTATPATPATGPASAGTATIDKDAKAKDCKAQAAAKALHGKKRKQFLEDCAKS